MNNISYKILNKGLNKRQADLVGYLYSKEKAKTNVPTGKKVGIIVSNKMNKTVVVQVESKFSHPI